MKSIGADDNDTKALFKGSKPVNPPRGDGANKNERPHHVDVPALPSGWWIAPAVVLGVLAWVKILSMIF